MTHFFPILIPPNLILIRRNCIDDEQDFGATKSGCRAENTEAEKPSERCNFCFPKLPSFVLRKCRQNTGCLAQSYHVSDVLACTCQNCDTPKSPRTGRICLAASWLICSVPNCRITFALTD